MVLISGSSPDLVNISILTGTSVFLHTFSAIIRAINANTEELIGLRNEMQQLLIDRKGIKLTVKMQRIRIAINVFSIANASI